MNKETYDLMKIQESSASLSILSEPEEDVFNDI